MRRANGSQFDCKLSTDEHKFIIQSKKMGRTNRTRWNGERLMHRVLNAWPTGAIKGGIYDWKMIIKWTNWSSVIRNSSVLWTWLSVGARASKYMYVCTTQLWFHTNYFRLKSQFIEFRAQPRRGCRENVDSLPKRIMANNFIMTKNYPMRERKCMLHLLGQSEIEPPCTVGNYSSSKPRYGAFAMPSSIVALIQFRIAIKCAFFGESEWEMEKERKLYSIKRQTIT